MLVKGIMLAKGITQSLARGILAKGIPPRLQPLLPPPHLPPIQPPTQPPTPSARKIAKGMLTMEMLAKGLLAKGMLTERMAKDSARNSANDSVPNMEINHINSLLKNQIETQKALNRSKKRSLPLSLPFLKKR